MIDEAVGELPVDGLAGDEGAIVDKPEKLIGVGWHVGVGGNLAPGDRAVKRQAVALALPVLRLLEPSLQPGALVIADDIDQEDLRPFLDYVRARTAATRT